jgi:type IV pilus assembly protein PilB
MLIAPQQTCLVVKEDRLMIESLKPLYNRSSHLGEQLVNDGLISQDQLQTALVRQTQIKKRLGETLLQMGCIPTKTLGRYLEAATKCQFVELADWPVDSEVAQRIPEMRARRLQALPIKDRGHDVLVAMSDPLNLNAVDEIAGLLNRRITPVLAFESDLAEAINKIFLKPMDTEELGTMDEAIFGGEEEVGGGDDVNPEDAPVVKLVNNIIVSAVAAGASDIHIEPQETSVRVRYRVDGMLLEQTTFARNYHASVAARIKIMARCNISERRRPQDGRIPFKRDGRENDLRVSFMPTIYGEKVVMRILERNSRHTNLEQMGFSSEQYALFEGFIKRPHGMILITGPTGSGKSTTLQAALGEINNPNINISTVEDPVEYMIAGVNHTQVDTKLGVTFANGLRTIVRQDPDVIMVGEIRDAETAEIAIQAALTGHLVLSTLHTNDAPGAVTRLLNMGVEPFLIASAVIGVVGQRLLRMICQSCREEIPATSAEIEALGIPHTEDFSTLLAHGRGCPKCGNRGMKGRTGVYEIMPMTEEVRDLVLKRAASSTIRELALQQGMKAMRDAGIEKVLRGITTLEEITRVLVMEE